MSWSLILTVLLMGEISTTQIPMGDEASCRAAGEAYTKRVHGNLTIVGDQNIPGAVSYRPRGTIWECVETSTGGSAH